MPLPAIVDDSIADWEGERRSLMARNIADLDLSIADTPVERMVEQLYAELAARDLAFRPPVYLSDQWGCPDGVALIGVPFYLADQRLQRIEEDFAEGIESHEESMRYLRHEAGHAFNYAYKLHERPDWHVTFGRYSRAYRDRYSADPFSHDFVRHILGWYAQKHPDEDFAETFAVWLTPGIDWRDYYATWPALRKLEYVDRVLSDVGDELPEVGEPADDDLPVHAMRYSLEQHYRESEEVLQIQDSGIFDGDLRNIFGTHADAPDGQQAAEFIASHRREVVGRIAHWTGEAASTVRQLIEFLRARAGILELRVRGLEASTLIELTAFGTVVMMNYRHTNSIAPTDTDDE